MFWVSTPSMGHPGGVEHSKSTSLSDDNDKNSSGGLIRAATNAQNDAAHPPYSAARWKWKCILCLLATFLVVFLNVIIFNDELQSLENDVPYGPLLGTKGDIYEGSVGYSVDETVRVRWNDSAMTGEDTHTWKSHEKMEEVKNNQVSSSRAKISIHPRVACFMGINNSGVSSCTTFETNSIEYDAKSLPSIPKLQRSNGKGGGSTSDDVIDLYASETEECKLSDPSYQTIPAAPSTCNDIHALGFRFGPTKREPISGMGSHVYPSGHKIKYLTSGGYRSVWTVSFLDEMEDLQVIMKTNQLRRGWSSYYLDQNRRDILISERAGNSPTLSNLLPVHKYCAFSSIVPFATAGVLDDYVYDRLKEGELLSAEEQYNLAMQAARGLYQAHLYSGGKATHTHADVKPPQFLLFEQPPQQNKNASTTVQNSMPIMQINDFNRGKFLTRSIKTNETCPFRMCHVHHKGSLYRSPEEYMKCADQSDRIDVFSLAGVFYYILSDGEKPWYYVDSYQKGVDAILRGEHPRLPDIKEYTRYGERIVKKVKDRSKHPLLIALKNVMRKCWAFEPKDRPSSLQVVRMLEDKWHEINPSKTLGKG